MMKKLYSISIVMMLMISSMGLMISLPDNISPFDSVSAEDTVFCYFDSIPNTEITTGELYLYHPVVVSNGTYAFYMNNNGALVVSNITGNVTGYPIAGIYDISLYVIDSDGNIAYQNWTLTVSPVVVQWDTDNIMGFIAVIAVMMVLTIFNLIGYIKNIFLIQGLTIALLIFAIPLIWNSEGPSIATILIGTIGNVGMVISGFFKE